MATLMRDPVILPSSRAVIDRSTIKSHLLSDTKDPFNRAPLALEDVIPSECLLIPNRHKMRLYSMKFLDPELKERIDAFLAERRNKDTALDMPEEEVVKMDLLAD